MFKLQTAEAVEKAPEVMKRRPTHPGELLKEDILPTLKMSQVEFADLLTLSRKHVNEILAGKASISPDTAVKLGALFGNEPQFWSNMQGAFDVWEASQRISQDDLAALHKMQPQMQASSASTAIQKVQFR